ncbi:hypothetical protein G9A89_003657 [Geosiphon pyriformis]|nr:hypothetical protein G9A89_003657 [Geosiphon pyriformis]
MPAYYIFLFSKNIDPTNIAHSKLPDQITHWGTEDDREPELEHKKSNLASTEPIEASNKANLVSRPPTLLVRTLELLRLRLCTSSTTGEKQKAPSTEVPFETISESSIKSLNAAAAIGKPREDGTKGPSSTKLNLFTIPETQSANSSRECSKDAKRPPKEAMSTDERRAAPPKLKAPEEKEPEPKPESKKKQKA